MSSHFWLFSSTIEEKIGLKALVSMAAWFLFSFLSFGGVIQREASKLMSVFYFASSIVARIKQRGTSQVL